MKRYGVPLDSRSDYVKLDWLMWTTVMTEDKEYIDAVIHCVYNFINETEERVPISDFYFASTASMVKFQNRSVLGGAFILLMN